MTGSSSASEELFARAKQLIPGGVSSPVRAFGSVGGTPRYMARGEGATMVDEDGRRYLDFCMAWGPLILGHAHPAVVKAIRLQEKSRQVGFEWNDSSEVWEKVEEETLELKEAVESGDIRHIEEEFGDLMFSLINYARFLHIDAETALERTNRKFIDRFSKMEQTIVLSGRQMTDLSLQELDAIWNAVKKQNRYD